MTRKTKSIKQLKIFHFLFQKFFQFFKLFSSQNGATKLQELILLA